MKTRLLSALAILVACLPAAQPQDQPPVAEPGGSAAHDVATPTWVEIVPPCNEDPAPAAGGEPAEITSQGETANPQVLVVPAGGSDRLAFDYDSFEGVVEFDYRSDAGDRRMRIDFEWLHEFLDEDGDGRLDVGEEILQSTRVTSPLLHYARTWEGECGLRLQWVYLLSVDAQDLEGMDDEEQAAFLEDKPRLLLRFTHLAAERGGYSPARVKIDIGVDDYEFTQTGSVLAFTTLVGQDDEAVAAGNSVSSSSAGSTVAYTWLPTADADGQEVQVRSAVTAAGDDTNVTFVYPQADHILHDPELGLLNALRRVAGYADLDPRALVGGLAVGSVLLLGISFARRRWP